MVEREEIIEQLEVEEIPIDTMTAELEKEVDSGCKDINELQRLKPPKQFGGNQSASKIGLFRIMMDPQLMLNEKEGSAS